MIFIAGATFSRTAIVYRNDENIYFSRMNSLIYFNASIDPFQLREFWINPEKIFSILDAFFQKKKSSQFKRIA